ncbi:Z1 domain-containing protein [Pedobacter agri]|uniref:Z1 domain-containing protein n=1 Tax=Pedobacter agri TaxID=454586 RepID=UPI002930EDAB|nr:Z1 domain-containing protein [Pedobacter agri]
MAEIIEIQHHGQGEWTPSVGEETLDLLTEKGFRDKQGNNSVAGEQVLSETIRILKACGDPSKSTNAETGIVIGYVQSGKTLSFTTVTALARDNEYRIIIVLGGVSIPLLSQSTKRLTDDLRINERYSFEQKWTLLTNPTRKDESSIANLLNQWQDETYPKDRCKTILITVMKHGSHLKNLREVLSRVNLSHAPTLIIDDESDQASLNNGARSSRRDGIEPEDIMEGNTSMIYRRINQLRNILPHFTYLQYTATPQANLFINLMDRLSPNFIRLLTPGSDYTGGIAFFRGELDLVREIPVSEIGTVQQPLEGPPESLQEALRFFYLGVAAGNITKSYKKPGQKNRSMLVHPSRLQGDHTTYLAWLNTIKNSWQRMLKKGEPEEKEAFMKAFESTYAHLASTVEDLPSFSELSGVQLIHAIEYTPIKEVNSRLGSTPQIKWQDDYAWILVGGQSMDRGFTVEGLTVTYMPRNIGMGTVDTILQRARFYGYKKPYLGYCRVFLDEVTIDAYGHIVDHEEDIRNRLAEFDKQEIHLDRWNREVVLNSMLRLTRSSVLYDDLQRDDQRNRWLRISVPHDADELIAENRAAVKEFLSQRIFAFKPLEGHIERTTDQIHLHAELPLKDCLGQLLNKVKYTYFKDSSYYSSLRALLQDHLEKHPEETCQVYLMGARSLEDWTRRTRGLSAKGEIKNLFQGSNSNARVMIYPGDERIKNNAQISIQIHMLDLRDSFDEVPTLAIWTPGHIGKSLIRTA